MQDYIELGEHRSLTLLCERYRSATGAVVPSRRIGTLKAWSTRYGWAERALHADAERIHATSEQQYVAEQQQRAAARAARLDLAAGLRSKSTDALAKLTPAFLAKYPMAIVRLAEAANAIEYREMGEPEHINRLEATGKDGAPIGVQLTATVEWLDLRARLLAALQDHPAALAAVVAVLQEVRP